MRYAIVSDIHANLQAWKATLLDIRSLGVDQIICLGDIVGYGPNPSEVLQSVHSHVDHIILGNHDAVACGMMNPSGFHDAAREIINWTTTQLNEKARKFLRSLPLTLAGPSFRCAHGDFANPGAFNYIIEPQEALPSWKSVPEQILFVGHTHEPSIHLIGQSGTPHIVRAQDFVSEPEKRYIVNVGSIGQPRDKDARASYCIHDTDSNLVMWRRIPFDIDAFRKALHDAGVSEAPSHFLRMDPRKDMPPIREMVNFTPAVTPDKAVKDAVQVQQLTTLKRTVRKWKLLSAIILLAGLATASSLGFFWWKNKTRSTVITDPDFTSIDSTTLSTGTNMLLAPSVSIPVGISIPGWNIKLGDKTQQSVQFDVNHPEGKVFTLSSFTRKDEISLISPTIMVTPRRKMQFTALVKKSSSFSGNVAVVISAIRRNNGRDELIDPLETKAPNQIRQANWIMAKHTFDIPSNISSIRLHVRGTFTGEILVRNITLENKE